MIEIGVGTGRVAVPLARAGLPVIGVDLSGPMLAEMAAKQSAAVALRADATALPLRDGGAAAVLACHVLHLIPDWPQAVSEILRVLRPGGLLLACRGRGDGLALRLQQRR